MAVDASFSLLTGNDIETRRIRAGDVIVREGEKADELFVIKSGHVRIQVGNRTMTDLAADNIFGEMALIDSEPRSATAVAIPARPAWRGLIGFNMLTGLALGIGGWFLGGWIGGQLAVGHDYLQATDQNDAGIFLGYIFALLWWLVGLGFANYPLARLRGHPPSLSAHDAGGWTRYFKLCTDHKVVGIQYLFGMITYFLTGGLFAMAIRTEPPHSPPAPIPWKTRSTVSSTAPQMPMLAKVGTQAIRKVAMPIISRVAISVALRPMRSP